MSTQTIERTTLSNLVYNEPYARKVLPFIKPEYFSNRHERVVFEEINILSTLVKDGTENDGKLESNLPMSVHLPKNFECHVSWVNKHVILLHNNHIRHKFPIFSALGLTFIKRPF